MIRIKTRGANQPARTLETWKHGNKSSMKPSRIESMNHGRFERWCLSQPSNQTRYNWSNQLKVNAGNKSIAQEEEKEERKKERKKERERERENIHISRQIAIIIQNAAERNKSSRRRRRRRCAPDVILIIVDHRRWKWRINPIERWHQINAVALYRRVERATRSYSIDSTNWN